MAKPDSKPIAATYISEFDGLRALAAFGVMTAHFLPMEGGSILERIGQRLGGVGVDLFFALSGFLITNILLSCRELVQPTSATLRQFYARRVLRICPVYYLAFLLFALGLAPNIRDQSVWFLTYTVNFGKAGSGNFYPLNHFWTLAVEEQFYLAWPLIVLLAPINRLAHICVVGSCLSLLLRLLLSVNGCGDVTISQFTPCCLEPLLLGSAFATRQQRGLSASMIFLLIGSALTCALTLMITDLRTIYVTTRAAHAVCFSTLIYVVACLKDHAALMPLRAKPVVYLGKISYGIYVWHLPILWATRGGFPALNVVMPDETSVTGAYWTRVAMTILISSISWHLFERPITQLKEHFPYRHELSNRRGPRST